MAHFSFKISDNKVLVSEIYLCLREKSMWIKHPKRKDSAWQQTRRETENKIKSVSRGEIMSGEVKLKMEEKPNSP